jgi:hypothetical protein
MSLLLSLLLLAPRVGLAQEQASQPPPDATTAQEEAPKAQQDAPTAMQPARTADAPPPGSGTRPTLRLAPERPSQGERVSAELGAALLTGAGGLVLGYLSTFALFSEGISSTSTYALAAPTLVGIGLGVSIGTFWGGQAAGGEGDFGSPLLGTLLGGGAALLLSIPMGNPVVGLLLAPPLMILGSIIGYEITEQGDAPPARRVQPLLSVSPRGAMVGLAAAF